MQALRGILQTVALLDVIQGLIVSMLLWRTRQKNVPNRMLARILFLSLACFNLYGENENWFGVAAVQSLIYLIPLVVIMPVGPLLCLYVRASLEPRF